ncbi:DUF6690 family protein [Pirellulaceae bacterium SH467]|jgi:hypothetical protein
MLSNFLQKPTGTAAILVAAIGGPYAAFETDVGTAARKMLMGGSTTAPGSPDSIATSNPNYLQGATASWPDPTATPMPPQASYPISTYPAAVPANYPNPGYPVSSVPGNPVLESRQGPAGLVPGGTHQLWDYTIGVPHLQQLQQQPGAIGGGEVHDLREVLRFDIQPGWLPQRFSRVSTVLSNVQMDGLRVPLITGTRPSDLAGTLTYYFDAAQSLRRINLHGLTGDPSALAQLMIQFYGLQPEASLGGQLFTTRWNNRVTNVLHIAPAPIMYAGADHSKYIVFLELNQANASYALSEEASGFLKNSQAAQRW